MFRYCSLSDDAINIRLHYVNQIFLPCSCDFNLYSEENSKEGIGFMGSKLAEEIVRHVQGINKRKITCLIVNFA